MDEKTSTRTGEMCILQIWCGNLHELGILPCLATPLSQLVEGSKMLSGCACLADSCRMVKIPAKTGFVCARKPTESRTSAFKIGICFGCPDALFTFLPALASHTALKASNK